MKINRYLLGSALVAALGGLLFGFDTIVISGTTDALEKLFHLNKFWLGFTVASALIGTIVGSVAAGRPSDAFGPRRRAGRDRAAYVVSAIGCAWLGTGTRCCFSASWAVWAIGGASVVSPMYIAEISPARLRGRLVAVQQFNIVLGCLLAFLSNYMISQANLGGSRLAMDAGRGGHSRRAVLLPAVPDPQFAALAGGKRAARRGPPGVLADWAPTTGNVDEEVEAIQASLALDHHRVEEPFFRRQYRKPILLAVAIAMFNQLSGVNALWYYAPAIFRMAGAGHGPPCSSRSFWAW